MEIEEQAGKKEAEEESEDEKSKFKKPDAIVGPRRGHPGKHGKPRTPPEKPKEPAEEDKEDSDAPEDNAARKAEPTVKDPGLDYAEPAWGGGARAGYSVEVLKSGVIAETIPLTEKSFYVIGRLPLCDITLAHPTISRYHAILQFRAVAEEGSPAGLYIYDLGSTHGTYWNGNLIKPRVYARVQGGHMLRFGFSQRKYILQAPPDDQEEESEYTLSELKQKRVLEKQLRQEEQDGAKENGKEDEGIDWGMGEDADEETDLQENPYATSLDEELVLDDPKKTLRGWFEREGYDLQYRTEEKGIGQFLCWVDLPLENVTGHSVRAEALVKGKKKESVVQCALEACKILDRYGLLRQANHEARKRKVRNWEEQDYYDSDEDNFLDRTGSVEKKREQRMRQAGKLEEKVETYDSLLKKHEEVTKRINSLSSSLNEAQGANARDKEPSDEDALDAFMSTLTSKTLTKGDIAKMKSELNALRKEQARLVELVNLTRPADLPPLAVAKPVETDEQQETKRRRSSESSAKSPGAFLHGAMQKKKEKRAERKATSVNVPRGSTSEPEEEEEEEEEEESDSDSEEGSRVEAPRTSNEDEEATRTEDQEPEGGPEPEGPAKVRRSGEKRKRESKPSSRRPRERARKTTDQELYRENYSMWVPPQGQEGDGKTSLNERYGY